MAKLSLSSHSKYRLDEARFVELYHKQAHATPVGSCPLNLVVSALETAKLQSCGKCVPCRDGLPKLLGLVESIRTYNACAEDLTAAQALAESIYASADCAIGIEAAKLFIESATTLKQEYLAHIETGACVPGVGQSVPCETMCPAHIDIAAYIALVGAGDYAGAIKVIRNNNPFPTACALVCEHPCENRCRRSLVDAPINIRGIKKYAVDSIAANQVETPCVLPESGKRVAIIGAGPSGLSCAYYLALAGHHVSVFEARAQLGGMLRYGIPAYRLPRERLDQDIAAILSSGNIKVQTNCTITAEQFRNIRSTYDAVYVAIGAHAGNKLGIENDSATGVISAVEFLREIGDERYPNFTGKRVIVVGGGNVAMDCARTAVRAGAQDVSVVYRRRIEDMTALEEEITSAIAEGVEMITLEAPVAVEVNEHGNACALITQPQMISAAKNGRPAPVAAEKPQRRIKADVILVAAGQRIMLEDFAGTELAANRKCFIANEHLAVEGAAGLFVGGDCQTGPATAIAAIAAGHVAAANINEYLGGRAIPQSEVAVPYPKQNKLEEIGRLNVAQRPARERKNDFEYVELPISEEEIVQECGRCLRCDHFGCGSMLGGRTLND